MGFIRLKASPCSRKERLALGAKSFGSGTRFQMNPVEREASMWPNDESQMRFWAVNSVLL